MPLVVLSALLHVSTLAFALSRLAARIMPRHVACRVII